MYVYCTPIVPTPAGPISIIYFLYCVGNDPEAVPYIFYRDDLVLFPQNLKITSTLLGFVETFLVVILINFTKLYNLLVK